MTLFQEKPDEQEEPEEVTLAHVAKEQKKQSKKIGQLYEALVGDPLNPKEKPGLIGDVNAKIETCRSDRKRIWWALGLLGSAIVILVMWKITGTPQLP